MFDESQKTPAVKPSRPGRGIVRLGVIVGIVGFVITAVGAFMLGQGPGPLEIPGNVIHRVGMVGMLGGFLVVLFGYRWPQIRAALAPFAELTASETRYSPSADLNHLVNQVGPDVGAPLPPAGRVTEAVVVAATVTEEIPPVHGAPPPMGPSRPADGEWREASSPAPAYQSSFHASQAVASTGRTSRGLKRGAAIGSGNVTLLIVGWTMVGLAVFLGLMFYFLGSRAAALVVAVLGELGLGTALLVIAVHGRGALRTFAIGAVIPVIVMLLASAMFLAPVILLGPGVGGMWMPGIPGGPWRRGIDEALGRSIQLFIQLFVIGSCGTFALFIRMTLMMFDRRQGPGEP